MKAIRLATCLGACLWLLSAAALAQQQTASLQMMIEQQQALRAELAKGVEGITPRQARIIDKAQSEFFALVDGKQALDQLGIDDKVRIENALERINAQVANTRFSEADQQVCWREVKVGSKMMVTRCGTQQEIDDARDGARAYLNRPRICVPPGCGT